MKQPELNGEFFDYLQRWFPVKSKPSSVSLFRDGVQNLGVMSVPLCIHSLGGALAEIGFGLRQDVQELTAQVKRIADIVEARQAE